MLFFWYLKGDRFMREKLRIYFGVVILAVSYQHYNFEFNQSLINVNKIVEVNYIINNN